MSWKLGGRKEDAEMIHFIWVFNTLWTWSFLFRKQGLCVIVFVTSEISNQGDGLPNVEKLVMTNGEESS